MKKLSFLPLLLLLSALLYLSDKASPPVKKKLNFISSGLYKDGLLLKEYKKVDRRANYKFEAIFDIPSKNLFVKEYITWINHTQYSTKEIQLHFYANAYKSNRTLFANAYHLKPENRTCLNIQKCLANNEAAELNYFQPEIPNPSDSTVAKINLNKLVLPGDSVKLYFEYTLKIPIGIKRFGAARGRNFYFISQWFPKVGVFENGYWTCSQYHPYLNFYSDFGDYSAEIKTPQNYFVASTGVIASLKSENNFRTYSIKQSGVHDFAFLITDEVERQTELYTRKDGSQVQINAIVQPERAKYFERYFKIVKQSLEYFEDNIGIYPYQSVTLVDVPRTSASSGMEYPTLFNVSAELFARPNTGQPEYLTAHEFSHQFYQGLLANNEVYEAWLDEGFASYISTKIMYKYHQPILENFKVAQFIPVFGLNFLSYNDIPIIYTLTDALISEGARSITSYYQNLNVGTIADTSYKLPTRLSYVVNSYNKPELMLLTLERYLGSEKMMNILKDYYDEFKYKHPAAKDFISIVQKNCREDMSWFFDEFYRSSKSFDYRVTSLRKIGDTEYEVLVERLGDGIFKTEIALVTDKNTLTRKWDGLEKWKIFRFNTVNKVISAEVDPQRKNLLDINFANNSYTIEENSFASTSIATRWFFWVQNALMILGSIG